MFLGAKVVGLTLSLGLALLGPLAQAQDFEDLVEDALSRNGSLPKDPGAGEAPFSAVPPRLMRNAPVGESSPRAERSDTLVPDSNGPRPYTPPSRARAGTTVETDAFPAAGTFAQESGGSAERSENDVTVHPAAPERAMESLGVEEVNGVIFQEHTEDVKGPSPLILKAQILLDRAGASPGVIDGVYGGNVAKAVAAVETVLNLPIDGRLDLEVWKALGGDEAPDVLVSYTISEEDASYRFLPAIPKDFAEQAQLKALGFTSPEEMLGERFHMDTKLLAALNPGADFRQPGTEIIVAAIEGQLVTGTVTYIEADKARRQVRAYDDQNRLIVAYPATIGSAENPSPSGDHKVNTIAPNPVYYYNPENFVQGNNRQKLELPPGPNNPVGTMWIDLTEPSYGIHGTPEPSKIDKTNSNGCVRLTNWDAEELATLVQPGVTIVSFVDQI